MLAGLLGGGRHEEGEEYDDEHIEDQSSGESDDCGSKNDSEEEDHVKETNDAEKNTEVVAGLGTKEIEENGEGSDENGDGSEENGYGSEENGGNRRWRRCVRKGRARRSRTRDPTRSCGWTPFRRPCRAPGSHPTGCCCRTSSGRKSSPTRVRRRYLRLRSRSNLRSGPRLSRERPRARPDRSGQSVNRSRFSRTDGRA